MHVPYASQGQFQALFHSSEYPVNIGPCVA